MEKLNFHTLNMPSCCSHYITHVLSSHTCKTWIFFLFFLLLQHKVVLDHSVSSQQKATFDLGSILLCLTAEHLNT